VLPILLKTKLAIPPLRPRLVERARLIERLDTAALPPLALIVAPPGFGKTTLANQWAQLQDMPRVCWFTVDQDDNDPIRFFGYVIAALQSANPSFGTQLVELLQSAQADILKPVIAALINELSTQPEPILLVIDDYHEITNRAVHDALIYLLNHLPDTLRLILTTRIDPPLPLARLRANGQLLEVRAADLRFSPDEAASFFQAMGLELQGDDITQLNSRTEGWIAGLQMAALSMQGRDSNAVRSFVSSFSGSHRHVVDYLLDEVLQRQPEPVQDFLCETSILGQLSAPLCDTVTERQDSDELLKYVDQANLFVMPVDSERRWYRYHRLFADVLRHRLQKSDPQRVRRLHTRASEWYEAQGVIGEAVSHAVAAGNTERAVRLVEAAAHDLWTRQDMLSVRAWLHALPDAAIQSSARLTLLEAQIKQFQGKLRDVEGLVSRARQLLANAPDADPILTGELAALSGMFLNFAADPQEGLRQAQQAVEVLPVTHPLHATTVLNLGIGHWLMGRLPEAAVSLQQAQQLCLNIGNRYQAQVATAYLAETRRLQGRLREAESLYRAALDLTPDRLELPDVNGLYIGLGALAYERNDLEVAEQLLVRGSELGQQEENILVVVAGLLFQARLAHARRQTSRSVELLAQALQLADSHQLRWLWSVPSIRAIWSQLALLQGNEAAVQEWADTLPPALPATPPLRREAEQLALARFLIAREESEAALSLLAQVQQTALAAGRRLYLMQALALRAVALQNAEPAFRTLEEAMAMAEPEGFVRLFVDEGEPMRRLLERYVNRRTSNRLRPYASRLLRAFAGLPATTEPAIQNLPEPLSEREIEILGLMSEGLSNADIANRLFLSVTTVKKHATNIFGKLGAANRQEAVERARQLRLIL